jgi:hypothetical protein
MAKACFHTCLLLENLRGAVIPLTGQHLKVVTSRGG